MNSVWWRILTATHRAVLHCAMAMQREEQRFLQKICALDKDQQNFKKKQTVFLFPKIRLTSVEVDFMHKSRPRISRALI
jgi:hypothetical protein